MESPFSFCFSTMIPYFIPSLTVLFSSSFFLLDQPAGLVFLSYTQKGRNAVPFLFPTFPPPNYISRLLNPKLTLPTVKAGGFLFLPPLHWQIPYGTAMSYTVSTGYLYTVPACPAVQFSYLYADCSCSPFFKILMPAFVSRS